MYDSDDLKTLKRHLSKKTLESIVFFEYLKDIQKNYKTFSIKDPSVLIENKELYEKWKVIPRYFEKYLDDDFFKKMTVDQLREMPNHDRDGWRSYSFRTYSRRSNSIIAHNQTGNCLFPFDYIDKYQLIDGKWQLVKSYRKKY